MGLLDCIAGKMNVNMFPNVATSLKHHFHSCYFFHSVLMWLFFFFFFLITRVVIMGTKLCSRKEKITIRVAKVFIFLCVIKMEEFLNFPCERVSLSQPMVF